jgi:hypothetical protein
MTPRPFGIMDALKFGFSGLWNNLWRMFLVYVGAVGAIFALAAFFGVGGSIASVWSRVGSSDGSSDSLLALVWVAFFIIALFGLILKFSINMASGRIALDACEAKKTEFKSLLPKLSTYIVAVSLFNLLTIFGFMLLVIPGLICLIKYNFVDLIVIDTRMGVIDAFKRSGELTYGYKWYLCGVYALSLLLMFFSIITIVGPFVLSFVYVFSRAYIYRKLVEAHDKDIAQFTAVPPNM